jgi:adenosylcobinamide-GDP ribazoletransferase
MNSFRLALGFLTIFPVLPPHREPGDLGRAAVWFPAVGLILGSVLVLLWWISSRLFPPLVAATLTVAGWALLTGGMHLDGVADSGDGLFASAAPERRLEILRDPRLGTFGALCLTFLLLLKIFALAALPISFAACAALWTGPLLARWLLLWVARQPPARLEGMGAEFSRGLSLKTLLLAGLLPLASLVLGGARALVAALGATLVTAGLILFARRRLGGMTGDVFGLSVELTEAVVLLAFVAMPMSQGRGWF